MNDIDFLSVTQGSVTDSNRTYSNPILAKLAASEPLGSITSIASTEHKNPILENPRIMRFAWQCAARHLLPQERVARCFRQLAPFQTQVDIMYSGAKQRANYRNLFVCGSVWHCPVCAARITEQRRIVLQSQLERLPYQQSLITYTLRHDKKDKLQALLKLMTDCRRAFKSGRKWQDIAELYGFVAAVRALEVTHGDHGWHVHVHELALWRGLTDINAGNLADDCKTRWQTVVARHKGKSVTYQNGLDFRVGDDVGDYVTKYGLEQVSTWTAAHEVTKQPTKRGKAGGRTPLELLHDNWQGDRQSGAIWREYATCFKSHKQLVPSSFAALLGEKEQPPDGVIAESQDKGAILLASLTREQWATVVSCGARGQTIAVADSGDVDKLRSWLQNMGIELSVTPIS